MVANKHIALFFLLCCILLGKPSSLLAQSTYSFLIYLEDKSGSPYSLSRPLEFLSQRSLDRRDSQEIGLSIQDLPVNPSYLAGVEALNVPVISQSRWLNALHIVADSSQLQAVLNLSFVQDQALWLGDPTSQAASPQEKSLPDYQPASLNIGSVRDYGYGRSQVQLMGVEELHQRGFRGQGMLIAMMDEGFAGYEEISFFSHLREQGLIRDTYDFVDQTKELSSRGSHGLKVLSTMASYKPDYLIGTAPEAQYALYRTEDPNNETRQEEWNWLLAAERADSLGADVLNVSLGYYRFNYPEMNYRYADLDGNTALISRAADLAAAKGMLVVVSAGNLGAQSWQYLNAPADADSVLTVGALRVNGTPGPFTSKGPTSDGQLKPDVSAVGVGTAVASSGDFVTNSNGTSFAAPLVSGFVASLWQSMPHLKAQELIQLLRESGDQYLEPDTILGYGVPNYGRLLKLLKSREDSSQKGFHFYPNPLPRQDPLYFFFTRSLAKEEFLLQLFDRQGRLLAREAFLPYEERWKWNTRPLLNTGFYTLQIEGGGLSEVHRLFID